MTDAGGGSRAARRGLDPTIAGGTQAEGRQEGIGGIGPDVVVLEEVESDGPKRRLDDLRENNAAKFVQAALTSARFQVRLGAS